MSGEPELVPAGSSVVSVRELPADFYQEIYAFGADTTRYCNLVHLDARHALYASGNAFHVLDTEGGAQLTVPSSSPGGVTCVAATESREYVAIAYASSAEGASVHIMRVSNSRPVSSGGALLVEVSEDLYLMTVRILTGVGQQGVDAMAFNRAGNYLATVASAPDYSLSVWDWGREPKEGETQSGLLLRAPAFTAAVYRVAFCDYSQDSLITGGRQHLKFWKIANTFTGAKLKGEIAKFGILDSSDSTAFIELPSGNFLSGCGTGEMALWSHTTVLLVFVRAPQQGEEGERRARKCHDGRIEFMSLDLDGLFVWGATSKNPTSPPSLMLKALEARGVPTAADGWLRVSEDQERDQEEDPRQPLPVVITGGSDGYIRLWSGHELLQAQYVETEDGSVFFPVEPLEEIFLGQGCCPRNMSLSPDRASYLIQDSGLGGFLSLDIQTRKVTRLSYGHGGPVAAIACVNSSDSVLPLGVNRYTDEAIARSGLIATLGESGDLYVHDLISRRLVSVKGSTAARGTCALFIHNGLGLAAGFSDGSVRVYAVFHDFSKGADDCVALVASFRCFAEPIVSVTCSPAGVLTFLSERGSVFFVQTGLSLIRRDGVESLLGRAAQGESLNTLAQGLLNVRATGQEDEETQRAMELARRNAKGRLGITSRDIAPLGFVDVASLAFGKSEHEQRRLQNPFYVSPGLLVFTVGGMAMGPEGRLCGLHVPPAADLQAYRRSLAEAEAADQKAVPQGEQERLGTYDLTPYFQSLAGCRPRFASLTIPMTPLPGTSEGTIAKIEQHVVQERITAMMPSKGAMEAAMEALRAMEKGEEEEEEEEEEGEGPDGPEGQGEAGEPREKRKKKARARDPNDPLLEADGGVQYDFTQFSVVRSAGLVEASLDQDPLASTVANVLVRVAVDEGIRGRAEAAMAGVYARAENAGAPASATQGDPAILCAALAVAEARALYRSSLMYTFSLAAVRDALEPAGQAAGQAGGRLTLQAAPQGDDQAGSQATVSPLFVTPAAKAGPVISVPMLPQADIDDPEFVPDAKESVRLTVAQPIRAYAAPQLSLAALISDPVAKEAVEGAPPAPHGCIFSALAGGRLAIQPCLTQMDYSMLQAGGPHGVQLWDSSCSQCLVGRGLTALAVGLGGHVAAAGDAAGNLYVFASAQFCAMLARKDEEAALLAERGAPQDGKAEEDDGGRAGWRPEGIRDLPKVGLRYKYIPDDVWSTGTAMVRAPDTVPYSDDVSDLVPNSMITAEVQDLMEKRAELVPLEVKDIAPGDASTVEEQRLRALDAAASKSGQDSRQTVLSKLEALRSKFSAIVRENANLSAERRLLPHELCPDLLLANVWLRREERRAHEVFNTDLCEITRSAASRARSLLRVFPLKHFSLTVRAFANPAQQVSLFKALGVPASFEEDLCEAVGVSSMAEFALLMRPAAGEGPEDFVAEEDVIPLSPERQEPDGLAFSEGDGMESSTSEYAVAGAEGLAPAASGRDPLGVEAAADPRSLQGTQNSAALATTRSKGLSRTTLTGTLGRSGTMRRTCRPIDKIVTQVINAKLGSTAAQEEAVLSDKEMQRERTIARAAARAARQAELDALMGSMPDPHGVSPEDASSIRVAEETVGIFPLKTTEDYVASVSQLRRAQEADPYAQPLVSSFDSKDGKWVHFLLLVQGMRDATRDFNDRVLVLFAAKRAVVETVQRLRGDAACLTALIRELVGPEVARELDHRLARDSVVPDPDRLASLVGLHPEEEAYFYKTQVLDRFLARFQDSYIRRRLDPTSLVECVRSCVDSSDPSTQRLLEHYVSSCLGDRLVSREEAERLAALVSKGRGAGQAGSEPAPSSDEASQIRAVVAKAAELLGGADFGAPKKKHKGRGSRAKSPMRGQERDSDDDAVGMGDGDDDLDGVDSQDAADEAGGEQGPGQPGQDEEDFSQQRMSPEHAALYAALSASSRASVFLEAARAAAVSSAMRVSPVAPRTPDFGPGANILVRADSEMSEAEAARLRHQVALLVRCRTQIIQRMAALATGFDTAVRELQGQAVALQADLARMRVKILVTYQEAETYHTYMRRDAQSVRRLEDCRAEYAAVGQQLEQLNGEIVAKTAEATAVGAELQRLLKTFTAAVPLEVPYRSKLLKLYNKRYRPAKVRKEAAEPAQGPEAGEGKEEAQAGGVLGMGGGLLSKKPTIGSTNPDDYLEESSESSVLSGLSDGGADDGEIIDESAPPEGVSSELFTYVLELRDQKRREDQRLSQISAAAEQLRQQYLQLQKKEKQVLQSISQATRELTQFRAGKQRELNSLGTAALLSLCQYAVLGGSGLPAYAPAPERPGRGASEAEGAEGAEGAESPDEQADEAPAEIAQPPSGLSTDLSDALLFDTRALENLKRRIEYRRRELEHCRAIGQALRADYRALTQQEQAETKEHDALHQKLLDLQKLKFGHPVDIAALDGIAVNEQAMELNGAIEREEVEFERGQARKTQLLEHGKDELRVAIEHNTELVKQLTELERQSLLLEKCISERQKRAPKAWCSDNKQELIRQEYNSLKQTIVDRERELRSLVDEIAILKNHGN